MKTVWVRMTVKITSMFGMTARLSETDLALNALFCSKVPVISRSLKYKLCPPQLVSRVPQSWSLVDHNLDESNGNVCCLQITLANSLDPHIRTVITSVLTWIQTV